MVPPRIAVTAQLTPSSGPRAGRDSVGRRTYTECVSQNGAAPFMLAHWGGGEDATATVMDAADGLLLCGGDDISASLYNGEPSPLIQDLHEEKQNLDQLAVKLALERDIPILGICLGAQVINVFYGGTLIYDVIHQVPESTIRHQQRRRPFLMDHDVRIQPDSQLHEILGQEELLANSSHHQAIGEVGPGLVPTAWAPDGVVEAVEDPNRQFVLAVQWHPELIMDRPPHRKLFHAFVEACAAKRDGVPAAK